MNNYTEMRAQINQAEEKIEQLQAKTPKRSSASG